MVIKNRGWKGCFNFFPQSAHLHHNGVIDTDGLLTSNCVIQAFLADDAVYVL
jgi:hypothetical protein